MRFFKLAAHDPSSKNQVLCSMFDQRTYRVVHDDMNVGFARKTGIGGDIEVTIVAGSTAGLLIDTGHYTVLEVVDNNTVKLGFLDELRSYEESRHVRLFSLGWFDV